MCDRDVQLDRNDLEYVQALRGEHQARYWLAEEQHELGERMESHHWDAMP